MTKKDSLSRQIAETRRALGIARDETWPPPFEDTKRQNRLTSRIRAKMKVLFPEVPEPIIAAFAVDVVDFRSAGLRHEYYLKQFLNLKVPKDIRRAESLLIVWIGVELLEHASWHLRSLRRILPTVLKNASSEGKTKKVKRSRAKKM